MQPENAIEVKNVTKKFKVYFDKGYQLKEKVLFSRRNRYEERCVLRDISFQVKKGESVGLIGSNGCGKSTTLKLLTKIIYPDSGTIEMKGRVSSLIELGAGFHPDMSARENIYTNASIFGLTRKEIDDRIGEMIAFSELGEYIDNPVRTYSSGMYMRLAFSVAIHVNAEILLIDEILAVGDAHFQAKCFNRLRQVKAAGTTIVIVSHSTSQIEQICDKVIWIKDGQVAQTGIPKDVIQVYMAWVMDTEHTDCQKTAKSEPVRVKKASSYVYSQQDVMELKKSGRLTEIGNHELEITDYELLDARTGKHKTRFGIGESILLRIFYKRIRPDLKETMVSLAIGRNDGLNCYSTNCFINTGRNVVLKDTGVIEATIKKNPFMQGEYRIDLSLNKDYGPTYHGYLNACIFEIYNTTTDYGVCRPQLIWNLDAKAADCEAGQPDPDVWIQHLPADRILHICPQTAEDLTASFCGEYDAVVIEESIRELRDIRHAILQVTGHTKYFLIPGTLIHCFEHLKSGSQIFTKDGKKTMLIPMSTKNKMQIDAMMKEIKEEKGESKWLLDCFKEEKFSFDIMQEHTSGSPDAGSLTVTLKNHTSQLICLLDEGIAFSYYYDLDQQEKEGIRSRIREKVYPGDNLYQLDLSAAGNRDLMVSIVKEQEYWLHELLPDCMKIVKRNF